jgi:hypothetical protein
MRFDGREQLNGKGFKEHEPSIKVTHSEMTVLMMA